MSATRLRLAYAAAAAAVICIGLAWRSHFLPLPHPVKKYGGDSLWAAMAYLGVRFLFPRARIQTCAWVAFAFATAVEFSQLYHAPWIDSVRETRLGSLVLGSVFNWPDIPAYAAGIALAALADAAFMRRRISR